MSATTFPFSVLHRAIGAEVGESTAWSRTDRLGQLIGFPRTGSGNHRRYTLGHLVIAFALRGWLEGGSKSPIEHRVMLPLAREGVRLIDENPDNPPRFVVLWLDAVFPVNDPAAIVELLPHGPVHLIDVGCALDCLADDGLLAS